MLRKLIYILCGISLVVSSCKHDPPTPPTTDGNYPADVSKIIMGKCASCHNAGNAAASGNLRLDTWEELFKGGNTGAAIVPYSPNFSPLLYFINTDPTLGVVSEPRMPDGQDAQPLSKDEYLTIKTWVENGAPDKHGNIAFADDAATRQKIYMTQQGCDLLAVVDAKSKLVMRYVPVGRLNGVPESPHAVRFTDNGKYAFITLSLGNAIQKIDATTDQVVATEEMPKMGTITGQWNLALPSADGSKFIASDLTGGRIQYVDLENRANSIPISGLPGAHGIAANPSFDTFYVTGQTGNTVFKFAISDISNITKISLNGNPPSTTNRSEDPHEIVMALDYSKYFVTCQATNQVRVMNRSNDQLIKSIPVGVFPQEMAISKKKNLLFVSCAEDNPQTVGNATFRGSVYVIDMNTLNVVNVIKGKFSYVHGISVDDQNDLIYIASRNPDSGGGPVPHHTSFCGSYNGYYNVYDLNTFQPASSKRYEVTPDAYSVDTRFK